MDLGLQSNMGCKLRRADGGWRGNRSRLRWHKHHSATRGRVPRKNEWPHKAANLVHSVDRRGMRRYGGMQAAVRRLRLGVRWGAVLRHGLHQAGR